MALPKLVISRIDFDALKITPDETVTAFQDNRGAWPFSEIWGEHPTPIDTDRGGITPDLAKSDGIFNF